MTESDDNADLHLWRRWLSERAFVATNLPLVGLVAMLVPTSWMAPQGRYTVVVAMLVMLGLAWQFLVFLLRGIMWAQSSATAGRCAPPALRAQLAAKGARGWIVGGAISGVWIATVPWIGHALGIESAGGLALGGFLLVGPLTGLALSARAMNLALDRLAEPPNADEPAA